MHCSTELYCHHKLLYHAYSFSMRWYNMAKSASHPFPASQMSEQTSPLALSPRTRAQTVCVGVASWVMGAWACFVPTQQFRSVFY